MMDNFYVYIITNYLKTVLYVGQTNNLRRRLNEHENGLVFSSGSFASKYNVSYLLYYEHCFSRTEALMREGQIKGWSRLKKEALILKNNPNWKFLNNQIAD